MSPHFPSARFLLYTSLSPFLLHKALNGEQKMSGEMRGKQEDGLDLPSTHFSGKITANNRKTCRTWGAKIAAPRSGIKKKKKTLYQK